MATTPKKPSREKEETREGDMMFDVHPLHPSRPSPSQKLNRENRIKNACLSNSHSNIAASNDKRPLFVQIPATSSASLVSTSLPIQCLRLSNFFFFRGIFADNFLPNLLQPPRNGISPRSEGGKNKFGTYPRWDRFRTSYGIYVCGSLFYSSGRWMSGSPLSGFFFSSGFFPSGFLSPGFFSSGFLSLSAAFLPG